MNDININSPQDFEHLLKSPNAVNVYVKVKGKTKRENAEWETRLNKAVHACGCFEGGCAFFLALAYVLYSNIFQELNSSLASRVISGLGFIVIALFIGKLVGFLRVHIYKHLVISKAKSWAENQSFQK